VVCRECQDRITQRLESKVREMELREADGGSGTEHSNGSDGEWVRWRERPDGEWVRCPQRGRE
jgi:hypothetical protein